MTSKKVSFGKPVRQKKVLQKEDGMERTIELSISASNLLSMLYPLGYIHNNETITAITFDNARQGFDLKKNPSVVVPLKVSLRKEVQDTS